MRFFMALLLPVLLTLGAVACGKKDSTAVAMAAAPACSSTMYTKYGLAAFQAVNSSIISNATAPGMDAQIGTSFDALVAQGSAAVSSFTTNLADFLVYAYGGPDNYTGPTMLEAHTGLGITTAQYNAFVSQVVVPALSTNGVDPNDITNCFAPVVTDPNFVASIVGH